MLHANPQDLDFIHFSENHRAHSTDFQTVNMYYFQTIV